MSVTSDDIQDALDSEFRQILLVIKQYINRVNDNLHIEKYRVWLERLSQASSAEKFVRNKYLVELANQIQDNVLKPPFIFSPPHGPLPKLKSYKQDVEEKGWPYLMPSRSSRIDQNQHKRHTKSSKDVSPQKRKNKPKTIVRPFQKLGKIVDDFQIKSENSSWCDLTESATSFNPGCGDTDGQTDKKSLGEQHQNEGLKLQEHFMKKYEEASRSSSVTKNEVTAVDVVDEVEALKMRMKDLIEVKNALRDTHCLTEDRKKTIESLQSKLENAEKENAELKSMLLELRTKCAEWDTAKTREMSEFREKFRSVRHQETELLKKHHTDVITELEKAHTIKLCALRNELQLKIEGIKRQYEEKIRELQESNLELLKLKDEEICRLQQAKKITKDEGPPSSDQSEQIIGLKKCISKLDKVMHRNEKDYVKKIEKLKQELEVRDMTSQVQLQTQRADLIVRNTAVKQEELKYALNCLEEKYKKMMETLQLHTLESKKHDDRVIHELKTLLDKHNIEY